MREKLLWWYRWSYLFWGRRQQRLVDRSTLRWDARPNVSARVFRLRNVAEARRYVRYQEKMKSCSEKISRLCQDKQNISKKFNSLAK